MNGRRQPHRYDMNTELTPKLSRHCTLLVNEELEFSEIIDGVGVGKRENIPSLKMMIGVEDRRFHHEIISTQCNS